MGFGPRSGSGSGSRSGLGLPQPHPNPPPPLTLAADEGTAHAAQRRAQQRLQHSNWLGFGLGLESGLG